MTKREAELELQVWRERAQSVQNAVQGVNVQAQLLSMQSEECRSNIERCTFQLSEVVSAEAAAANAAGVASPVPPAGAAPPLELTYPTEQPAPAAEAVAPQ